MGSILELLRGAYTSHTINLLRLAAGTQTAIVAILSRMIDELVGKLSTADLTEFQRTRFASLVMDANSVVAGYYLLAAEKLSDTLKGLAEIEAKFARSTVEDVLKADLLKVLPSPNVLEALTDRATVMGAPAAQWWSKQSDDLTFRYVAEVQQGIAQSETNAQIVKRVWNRDGTGLLNRVDGSAEALVRSSVQSVANAARNATFEANDDVVQGTVWASVLDNRTSLICIARDGLKWNLEHEPVGHDVPYAVPPVHWNCRSAMVPWLKSFADLGIDVPEAAAGPRASMDGPTKAQTFDQWLSSKSEEFQDELLGPGRAALYRDGKITLNQLLDQRGNPLSVAQLKDRYGQ